MDTGKIKDTGLRAVCVSVKYTKCKYNTKWSNVHYVE